MTSSKSSDPEFEPTETHLPRYPNSACTFLTTSGLAPGRPLPTEEPIRGAATSFASRSDLSDRERSTEPMQRSRPQRLLGDLDPGVAAGASHSRDDRFRVRPGEVVRTQLDTRTITEVTDAQIPMAQSSQRELGAIDLREDV